MIEYVVGFATQSSSLGTRVLLIRKNRPAWQSGRLNGIGGKIEPGETPHDAMRREAVEEAGLDCDWTLVAWITIHNAAGLPTERVACFAGVIPDDVKPETRTDEEVGLFLVSEIGSLYTLSSVRAVVPLLTWKGLRLPVEFSEYPATNQADAARFPGDTA